MEKSACNIGNCTVAQMEIMDNANYEIRHQTGKIQQSCHNTTTYEIGSTSKPVITRNCPANWCSCVFSQISCVHDALIWNHFEFYLCSTTTSTQRKHTRAHHLYLWSSVSRMCLWCARAQCILTWTQLFCCVLSCVFSELICVDYVSNRLSFHCV